MALRRATGPTPHPGQKAPQGGFRNEHEPPEGGGPIGALADAAGKKIEKALRQLGAEVNGAICTAYSAEESDRLRGPQHDAARRKEIFEEMHPEMIAPKRGGSFRGNQHKKVKTDRPPMREVHVARCTWDMLQFGMRLGKKPRTASDQFCALSCVVPPGDFVSGEEYEILALFNLAAGARLCP
jgi:phage terminase large subunit-like protein